MQIYWFTNLRLLLLFFVVRRICFFLLSLMFSLTINASFTILDKNSSTLLNYASLQIGLPHSSVNILFIRNRSTAYFYFSNVCFRLFLPTNLKYVCIYYCVCQTSYSIEWTTFFIIVKFGMVDNLNAFK